MYLTAHRVKNPTSNEEGINTFYHEHGTDFIWPSEPWKLPDTHPGSVKHSLLAIKPGGNQVISYLDVLAPDGTSIEELSETIDMLYAALLLEEALGSIPNPTVYTSNSVCLRFGVDKDHVEKRIAELLVLKSKLMSTRVVYFFQ